LDAIERAEAAEHAERTKAAEIGARARKGRKLTPGERSRLNRMSDLRTLFRSLYPELKTKTNEEVDMAITEAVPDPYADGEELGRDLNVTFALKESLTGKDSLGRRKGGLRSLGCVDKTKQEREDFYEERHGKEDNERRKLARALTRQKRDAAIASAGSRPEVAGAAVTIRWATVKEVARRVGKHPAFKGLAGRSRTRTISKALDRLGDRIESEIRVGRNGFPTRYVRLRTLT
jgi:hypothetical protein